MASATFNVRSFDFRQCSTKISISRSAARATRAAAVKAAAPAITEPMAPRRSIHCLQFPDCKVRSLSLRGGPLRIHMLADPIQNEDGHLKIVLVLHQHVAVSL